MAVDKSIWPLAYGSDRKGYLVKRLYFQARCEIRTTNNAGEVRVATAVAMVLSLFLEGQLAV